MARVYTLFATTEMYGLFQSISDRLGLEKREWRTGRPGGTNIETQTFHSYHLCTNRHQEKV